MTRAWLAALFFLAATAAFSASLTLPAVAILLGGGGGGGAPFASPIAGVDDGYSGAGSCNSAGQTAGYCFQDANGFTDALIVNNPNPGYAIRSGVHANGSAPVGWHVPGVDYPVGINTGTGSYSGAWCNGAYVSLGNPSAPCALDASGNPTPFIDAVLYDWVHDPLGVGCSNAVNNSNHNSTSGNAAPNSIYCNADPVGGQINLIGFDWTPYESGTRICVGFELDNRATGGTTSGGTINVLDNYADWGPEPTCLAAIYGTTSGGVASGYPWLFYVSHTQPWHLNLKWNYVNQHDLTSYHPSDGKSFVINQIFDFGDTQVYTTGSINQLSATIEYNYFPEIGGRIANPALTCNGFDFNYNYVPAFNIFASITHGEMYIMEAIYGEQCPANTVPPFGDSVSWHDINNLITQPYGYPTFTDAFFNNSISYHGGYYQEQFFNILDYRVSLNTLVFNGVRGDAANPYMYMNQGFSMAVNSPAPIKTSFQTGDILTIVSPTFKVHCANSSSTPVAGTSSYSLVHYPTLRVFEVVTSGNTVSTAVGAVGSLVGSTTFPPVLRGADQGRCDSGIYATDQAELYCLYCSQYPGYTGDTGYAISNGPATFVGGTSGLSTTLAASSVIGSILPGAYLMGYGASPPTITQQQADNSVTGGTGGVSSTTLSYTVGTPVNNQQLLSYSGATLTACTGAAPGTCTITPAENIPNGTSLSLVNHYHGDGNYTLSTAENISPGTNLASNVNYGFPFTDSAGVGLQTGTRNSNHNAFANLMVSNVSYNALYLAGAQYPGAAFEGVGNPLFSDAAYGYLMSCFNASDLAAQLVGGYPPNYTVAPPGVLVTSGSPNSPYYSFSGISSGFGGANNFFLDTTSNNTYASVANLTLRTYANGGFAANGAGCDQ